MMPKITHLKEFEGHLWARLELDHATAEGSVHIFTDKEVRDMKTQARRDVWDEIRAACEIVNDSYYGSDD